MGAPGYAYFCSKNHIMGWIEEHLIWDEALEEHERNIKEGNCQCGASFMLDIAHYGGLNDCICLESEIQDKGIIDIGTDKIKCRIIDAIDKDDKPIEAYHYINLTKYRIPEDVISGKRFELEENKDA